MRRSVISNSFDKVVAVQLPAAGFVIKPLKLIFQFKSPFDLSFPSGLTYHHAKIASYKLFSFISSAQRKFTTNEPKLSQTFLSLFTPHASTEMITFTG